MRKTQSISSVFAPAKGESFRAREYAGVTIVNNGINLEAGKKEKKSNKGCRCGQGSKSKAAIENRNVHA